MGCCYSYEEEDNDRGFYTRPSYAYSRPTPTASSSQNNCHYSYGNQYKAVAPSNFRHIPTHRPVPKPNARAAVIKPRQEFKPRPGALYGEYKCGCGYFWVSRLSWRDRYQECKRCRSQVRPRNQRELRPTDFTRSDNEEGLEHPQHLCEMCKKVGGFCGKYK